MKKLLLFVLIFVAEYVYGQFWEPIESPTNSALVDCSFINQDTGWIITNYEIFKTTNGGVSWINQEFPSTPGITRLFNRIHFIDSQIGIIACGNYLYGNNPNLTSPVLWTTDGGENWINKGSGNPSFYLDGKLASATTAYIVGQYGNAKKTIDGGDSWVSCGFTFGYSGSKLYPVNQDTVYFVGIDNFEFEGVFSKTENGCINGVVTIFPSMTKMRAIYFQDYLNGWIGGSDGEIKYTNDGGSNWFSSNTSISDVIIDLIFTDSLNGWAVTSYGKILKTSDKGQNWYIEHTATPELNAICMTTPNNIGYAVGDYDLLKTTFASGSESSNADLGIKVFPNPFNDKLIVQFLNNPSINAKIEIYDLLGQLILEEEIKTKESEFDLVNLFSGTYVLKVMNGARMDIETIVKINAR